MSPKLSSGFVMLGSLMMFLGLCFLPAALGNQKDASLLEMGSCVFSAGALIVALGMYLKARMIKEQLGWEAPAETSSKRVRGGCDLCGTEVPVVLCRVHQVHLCGNCLGQHYDPRSCGYIPSTRSASGSKAAKTWARATGA